MKSCYGQVKTMSFDQNPSSYEGDLLNENQQLKNHLKWCVELLKMCPIEPCHEGPCSPMATPCDASCMDAYYFWETINKIENLIN